MHVQVTHPISIIIETLYMNNDSKSYVRKYDMDLMGKVEKCRNVGIENIWCVTNLISYGVHLFVTLCAVLGLNVFVFL